MCSTGNPAGRRSFIRHTRRRLKPTKQRRRCTRKRAESCRRLRSCPPNISGYYARSEQTVPHLPRQKRRSAVYSTSKRTWIPLPATSRLQKKKRRVPTETHAKASADVPSVPTAADVLIFSGAPCLTTAEPALH